MYYVYTDSSCQTVLQQINGSDAVLTTDANGNTDTVAIPAGTYYVKEATASEGYLLCDGDNPCSYSKNGVHEVTVTTDNTEDNPATVKCEETPGNDPTGITLYKLDSETGEAWAQGDTDLSGAQFTIKYYDGYYDEADLPEAATRTWVVETEYDEESGIYAALLLDEYKVSGDEWYYSKKGLVVLPLGTYTVQETLAPEGYLLEGQTRPADSSYTAPVHLGQVTQSGNEVQALSIGNEIETPEPVIRGGVEVQKRDVESRRNDPQGNGSFEGITLEITNKSEAAVMVDSDGDGVLEKFEPGEVVMTLTTDGNGYAATSSDALPYGSYTITETAVPGGVTDHLLLESEQDDGYLLGSDDGAAYTANLSIDFEIREEGVIVNLTGAETENGESVVSEDEAITDQVKRGDITLVKHDADTQGTMGSIPFEVTSLTTGESHVFWTDKNGDYDSARNAHSYRTDAGEDYSDGLWFYGYADWESFVTYGDDGYMTDNGYVDDSVGALPYDNYRIDELRCEANEGKTLIHDTFTLYDDIRVLNLGEYYNGDAPYIHTSAWASDTGTQLCYVGGDNGDGWVTLYDDVHYYNLTPGQTYGIYGVALDADTREPEYDHYGNEITAEVTFVAGETAEDTEIVDVEITEDGADADDADAEDTEDSDAEEAADETDADDADAEDTGDSDAEEAEDETDTDDADAEDTGDSDAEEAEDETDTDDADAEDAAGDTDAGEAEDETDAEDTGSGETAEGSIVSGSVEMVFTFPAETLAGKAAVAYEYLYHDGTPVTEHTDIDDESQTVWFPAISTTATDAEDGDDTLIAGPVSVNDRVDYTGLIAGRQYVMAGTLMDKATGEAVLVDGEAATAQIEFTPEEPDGSVTLTVSADLSGAASGELVMFEKCYLLGEDGMYVEVAAHEDIDDEAQTVTVMAPSISTTATDAADGDSKVDAGSVTVNDRVDYTGLIAGRQYVMAGTLMSKATGEAVLVNGEAATAQIEFTPEASDGYVTLSVAADASGMEGESLVMFEKCYLLGDDGVYVEVAAHEDLNDKAQTVKVKSPVGSGGGTVTTGLRNFGIIAVIGAAALAAALALVRRRRRAW